MRLASCTPPRLDRMTWVGLIVAVNQPDPMRLGQRAAQLPQRITGDGGEYRFDRQNELIGAVASLTSRMFGPSRIPKSWSRPADISKLLRVDES